MYGLVVIDQYEAMVAQVFDVQSLNHLDEGESASKALDD